MKILFFAFCVLLIASCTNAGTTPEAVRKSFEQKFPNATNVKWVKENKHEYEANFEWNGVKHSANFLDSGEWLETESPIDFNDLPEMVQTSFNSNHKDAERKAVAKIETSKNMTKFEVEIKKGVKTVEYFYDQNGNKLNN